MSIKKTDVKVTKNLVVNSSQVKDKYINDLIKTKGKFTLAFGVDNCEEKQNDVDKKKND